mgnify:FL=1
MMMLLVWFWSQRNERKFVLVNEREHLGFEYKDILTLFVSPVKMIPLASRRISPVVNMEKVFIIFNFYLRAYLVVVDQSSKQLDVGISA